MAASSFVPLSAMPPRPVSRSIAMTAPIFRRERNVAASTRASISSSICRRPRMPKIGGLPNAHQGAAQFRLESDGDGEAGEQQKPLVQEGDPVQLERAGQQADDQVADDQHERDAPEHARRACRAGIAPPSRRPGR